MKFVSLIDSRKCNVIAIHRIKNNNNNIEMYLHSYIPNYNAERTSKLCFAELLFGYNALD